MPAGEDRLSLLPDELLLHILSFIPSTKFLSQTSLLSKRWRRLWTHHPNLHISMPYYRSRNITDDDEVVSFARSYVLSVDRCLSSFTSPSIHSLDIDLWLPASRSPAESKANSKVADRWLRFAGLRSVKTLTVDVKTQPFGVLGRIPCSIFCCRSLVDLTVSFGAFPEVPRNFLGFRNLTKLCITLGIVSDQAVADLLRGCPLLEVLTLGAFRGLNYVEISAQTSPRLKHLFLLSCSTWYQGMGARIEAPNLRTIHFRGAVNYLDLPMGYSALREADLSSSYEEDFESFDDWMKIVLAISNVSVLKVNRWFYMFEIPKNYSGEPMFKNLKELHCSIDWITGSVLRCLTHALRECPLLEKLLIDLESNARWALKDSVEKANAMDCNDMNKYSSPIAFQYVDALLKRVEDEYEQDVWNPCEHLDELDYDLCHLKIITVKEFIGSRNEMQLLEFLLGKAIMLEQFIVFDLLPREEWDLEEVFATVPRVSSQVQMKLSLFDNKLEEIQNLKRKRALQRNV